MKVLKILRMLLKAEKPPESINGHILINEEEKWVKRGFDIAKARADDIIKLLEEEDK